MLVLVDLLICNFLNVIFNACWRINWKWNEMNVLAELNEAYCPSFEWRRKQKSSILGWPVFQTFKQWASLPRTVHSWFQNFETTRKWGIGFATRSLATRSSCVSSCYLWHHIEPQILDLLQAKQCNYFLFINRLNYEESGTFRNLLFLPAMKIYKRVLLF